MAVETILIPVAKQILGKLSDLAVEELGLLWNFRRELKKLENTVSTIQAVLRDAEEKQFHNHQVKDWLEKLSDVMYDADDVLDDLATEARRKTVLAAATYNDDDDSGRRRTSATTCWSLVCFLFSSLPQKLWYDRRMAHAIKAIRDKLDDISKDKEALHLEVRTAEEDETLSSRETDSCPPTIVVGREDDKKNIIQLLLNSNRKAKISVIPIVGMGGLGKTTLAQLVFDDDQVKAHFNIKVWVYVSQSFDVKVILGKMLRSINCEGQTVSDLDIVQTRLREEIKGKRFLFVLDDVWEEANRSWETLAKYLMIGAPGSKVLVTTRSIKVAEVGGETLKSENSTNAVEPYLLKGLTEDECWDLLVRKVVPRKMPRDPQVQQIGKQILRKCDGVPLAVSTLAGVLANSRDAKTEWPSFLQKSLASITKRGEEDPTMSVLQLSFNHLPSHMKHCFTYCKLFQKGFRFKIPMLVRLWVAQGYLETEDEGNDCFKTLWWRSFFQEVEMDKLGNMSTCRMHDLMHDLADSIAGEKIIRSLSSTVLKNIPSKTRHLLITGDMNDNSRDEDCAGHGLGNASKVRTLICGKSLSNKELEEVLKNFLRLRVLIIAEEKSNSDGEESIVLNASTSWNFVDNLKHLRYLGFKNTGRQKLPGSVTNLVNLQVLDINGCNMLEELPRNIKKLVSLKHLMLVPKHPEYLTHIPKEIGELKFLQTIPIFALEKRSGSSCINNDMVGAGLDELKGLNALCGKLSIKGLANADSPRKSVYVLKEKLRLQSLVLDWDRDDDNDDDVTPLSTHDEEILEMLWPHLNLKKLMIHKGYEGVKLPNWLSSLTNLVEFSLKDCKRCEYLPQLHQMLSLKKLTIDNCPMLKGIHDDDGDHCDSSLDNSPTTQEVDGEWPRFRCLSYLSIVDSPRLTRLPTFPTVEGWMDLENASLTPFASTMRMKMRRGGVDYSEDYAYAYDDDDDDTDIHPSSSSSTLVHPLSKLTKLTLERIDDDLESLAHPNPSSCLISLQELMVSNCGRCVKLPGSLCSSIYLTEIYLSDCETLEYLPPLHDLPSLSVLFLEHCPKLKGCWWNKNKKKKKKKGNIIDSHNHFLRLSSLVVTWCPKLTQMPLFPTVEGRLSLARTSAEALVLTMQMKAVVAAETSRRHLDCQQHSTTGTTTTINSPSSSSLLSTALVNPLSKLSELHLTEIDDLESLPEEGLRSLTSLRELEILDCPRLASLPPAMQYLTSLQSLVIRWCPQLTERCKKGGGEDWPNISHIPRIQLDGEILQDMPSNPLEF